jgi:hypothetical protein
VFYAASSVDGTLILSADGATGGAGQLGGNGAKGRSGTTGGDNNDCSRNTRCIADGVCHYYSGTSPRVLTYLGGFISPYRDMITVGRFWDGAGKLQDLAPLTAGIRSNEAARSGVADERPVPCALAICYMC